MRFRFIQENSLDATPIGEVIIDEYSRHELAALLLGLQYLFVTPELNEKVYSILEAKIMAEVKATGRNGMSLWEIAVLGSVRLCLNTNYDALQDLANNHTTLRGILGVDTRHIFEKGHVYKLSTIKENVGLLDEATLKEISAIAVKAGHDLLKKNGKIELKDEKIVLKTKADSFPAAANVHFPTDMNLLWDCVRKSLDTVVFIMKQTKVTGWRKISYIKSKIKKHYRETSEIHRKKGANYKVRLVEAAKNYLAESKEVSIRIKATIKECGVAARTDKKLVSLLVVLKEFVVLLDKHVDLLDRRVVKEEQILHDEKLFSIFEQHVEWLTKGKLHGDLTLGHNVLITTDQFQFILDHHVAEHEVDKQLSIKIGKELAKNYSEGYYLMSLSLDRGFFSAAAKKALQEIFEQVIMPKPGKKSAKVKEEEAEKKHVTMRKKHSAVESNINELQHSGLDFVPDKSLEGFKDYVAMGVLAHNLKRVGKILIEQKKTAKKAAEKAAKKAAKKAAEKVDAARQRARA